MVEKSSGPVVEREMFLMMCFVSGFFLFFVVHLKAQCVRFSGN